ncbi:polysaccharide deacetylase family protein [Clostridium sp. C2-6-12]|uniref:polysaccharide deacetylase family protein n=1 Tax=Clostridium sp. C2-6-12 TaxID=2698832 RepID=UPI001370EEC1|nr:polysaccharide deacetylase family protein [Clostridium sp. C2-6-12]
MSKAYLTIDDGPTKDTKAYIDFLNSKDITPIMFFCGEKIRESREDGIYAIQNGAIIGNHTYTHPHFSKLDLEECISEIERQEEQIDLLYKDAGVPRKYKLFRFPYADKGGKNKKALQEYLINNGFSRIDDSQITSEWYNHHEFYKDYDVFFTFDCQEYRLQQNDGFTREDIFKGIRNENPKTGGVLLASNAQNIFVIHDHPQTDDIYPNYFYEIINHVLDNGVEFIKPKFITIEN